MNILNCSIGLKPVEHDNYCYTRKNVKSSSSNCNYVSSEVELIWPLRLCFMLLKDKIIAYS